MTHHEDWILLGAEVALDGHATPVAGWPEQVQLAFEGFEKESFICFYDPGFMFGPMYGCVTQEAMTPTKRLVLVDLTTTGCLR